jgi:hypothetical protein
VKLLFEKGVVVDDPDATGKVKLLLREWSFALGVEGASVAGGVSAVESKVSGRSESTLSGILARTARYPA